VLTSWDAGVRTTFQTVHVKVETGRSVLYGLVGAALCIGGVVMFIQHIVNDETDQVMMPIALTVIGALILTYWVSGNSKAFVQLDFTKDKEVGSFQPAIISYATITNPCNLFSCLGKLPRHATRELKFNKKDAFAATSMVCAIRQGLKEKLHGVNKV
jgi:Ca2+/H+ antiporter